MEKEEVDDINTEKERKRADVKPTTTYEQSAPEQQEKSSNLQHDPITIGTELADRFISLQPEKRQEIFDNYKKDLSNIIKSNIPSMKNISNDHLDLLISSNPEIGSIIDKDPGLTTWRNSIEGLPDKAKQNIINSGFDDNTKKILGLPQTSKWIDIYQLLRTDRYHFEDYQKKALENLLKSPFFKKEVIKTIGLEQRQLATATDSNQSQRNIEQLDTKLPETSPTEVPEFSMQSELHTATDSSQSQKNIEQLDTKLPETSPAEVPENLIQSELHTNNTEKTTSNQDNHKPVTATQKTSPRSSKNISELLTSWKESFIEFFTESYKNIVSFFTAKPSHSVSESLQTTDYLSRPIIPDNKPKETFKEISPEKVKELTQKMEKDLPSLKSIRYKDEILKTLIKTNPNIEDLMYSKKDNGEQITSLNAIFKKIAEKPLFTSNSATMTENEVLNHLFSMITHSPDYKENFLSTGLKIEADILRPTSTGTQKPQSREEQRKASRDLFQ